MNCIVDTLVRGRAARGRDVVVASVKPGNVVLMRVNSPKVYTAAACGNVSLRHCITCLGSLGS
jgi:hypothetical protein